MPHKRHFEQTKRLGSWISLGKNTLVRASDLGSPTLPEAIEFKNCLVAHSGCGGIVALFSREGSGFSSNENCVLLTHLGSASPQEGARISLKAIESVVFMTWNKVADHLIVVLNTGHVRFYDYAGKTVAPALSIDAPVVCTSCENGFIAVVEAATDAKLTAIEYSKQRGYSVRDAPLPQSIRGYLKTIALVAINDSRDQRHGREVFISYSPGKSDSFICRCVFGTATPSFTELAVPIEGGRVLEMRQSPVGGGIAFIMEDGTLYCTNSGFSEVSLLARTEARAADFVQLRWCGGGCVAYLQKMHYESSEIEEDSTCTLFFINVNQPDNSDSISDLPHDACLLEEPDGIWALAKESLLFVQEVPPAAQRVFSVGSRAPGAMLLSTYDEFMTGDASAVRMLQNLERDPGVLVNAVADCVATAGFEFEAGQQKRLLRIAAFGRTFCSLCDSGPFVTMSKRLRVRNHLRFAAVGMLMTDQQLTSLGEERLLSRLALCNEHQAAFFAAGALELDIKPVMINWALCKLSSAAAHGKEGEKGAAKQIVKKLKAQGFNGFAEVAQLAKVAGGGAAALVLLDAETNPGQQVPMLLSIGEPDVALKRALSSADADLLFTVMVHMIRTRGSTVITALAAQKASRDLLLQYAGMCEGNQQLMVEYFHKNPRTQAYFHLRSYFQDENRLSRAISESTEGGDWEMLQECKSVDVQAAIVATKKAVEQTPRPQATATAFSPIVGGGTPFPVPMIEERYLQLQSRLIDEQTQLMREFKDCRFLQASAADTVRYALEHGRTSVAQRLKSEFSIPEKMYQRGMLSAYLCTSQWELIDDMSGVTSSKKTLLDGEAFVSALLAHKRPQQAKQYIPRIPQIELRMEYYVLCGDWFGAGVECKRNNDPDLLAQLKDRAKGNADVLTQIQEGWNTSMQTSGINFPKFFGTIGS